MFVDPRRLVEIEDFSKVFDGLGFFGARSFNTTGEPVLLVDPIYVADVYNPNEDDTTVYLRLNGVFIADFGGDSSCPVWWCDPHLVMPTSNQFSEDFAVPSTTEELTGEIRCDSGSLMFLPLVENIPISVRRFVSSVERERDFALLSLPPGKYTVFYEQFPHIEPNMAGLFRNIVAIRDSA